MKFLFRNINYKTIPNSSIVLRYQAQPYKELFIEKASVLVIDIRNGFDLPCLIMYSIKHGMYNKLRSSIYEK